MDGRPAAARTALADCPDPSVPRRARTWTAGWLAALEQDGHLDQRDAAHELASRFGERFTYLTANGHLAISQRVITAFRKAAGGPSWDQRSLCWHPRTESEVPTAPL